MSSAEITTELFEGLLRIQFNRPAARKSALTSDTYATVADLI